MNTKSNILTILMVAFALLCKAQSITQETARQKAMAFMEQMGMPATTNMKRAPIAHQSSTTAPYYVFNATGGRGFVIVSGDERTEEILGYSTESPFDEECLPEAAKTWLKGYADQLEAVQQGILKASPLHVKSHKAIEKLVKSVWDQGEASSEGDAFNQECPTIDGVHCYTGCVATAMAQIMRYHKWPNTLTTEIPGYKPNDNINTLDKLPRTKFDWNNMLDKYDEGQSAASCSAVAHLMRYCSQAVEMNYGTGSSGASSRDVPMALRTYFGYDVNTRYEERSDYTIESWDDLIYNELSESRPVFYSGSNPGGGHAFVCDGYDGNGFYHINWGWSGHFNGYFKLAILNPKGGETGSSSSNCGYSLEQGAVVGIQPPCGFNEELRMLTLKDFYNEDHVIKAQFSNRTGLPGTFEYGFAYHNINTESNEYHIAKLTDDFEPLIMRTVTADLDKWNLSNGTYRFYPYNILEGSGWYRVSGDFQKYYEVVVSGGKITSMTLHPRSSLVIKSLTCKGNQIVNMPQEIELKVSNTADEYNKHFYLFASKTNVKGEPVDQVCLPVEAGGEAETSLYFTPNSTGKWKIWVDINEEGSNDLDPIEVDIKSAPTGKANLSVVSCVIDSKADITFKVKIKNNSNEGYYKPINCYIFESGKTYNVSFDSANDPNIAPGATVELTFRIEGLEMGKPFYMRLKNYSSHQSKETVWLGNRYHFTVGSDLDPDAIDEVYAEGISEPSDIYTLSGVLVRKGATSLEGLPKGIYIINGKKQVVR